METPYDRHRFDNPSAWLDREERSKARSEGRPLGYGYAEQRQPPTPLPEKPFYAQEYSFTSGKLVNRKYNAQANQYASETTRADPWHYPNALKTEDSHHFKDHRRRSQNYDPRFWQPDPALSAAVPDSLVQHHLAAYRDEKRSHIDPAKMEPLFSETVRPQPGTLHELNVDLSCVSLPAREGGSSPSSRLPASRSSTARPRGGVGAGGAVSSGRSSANAASGGSGAGGGIAGDESEAMAAGINPGDFGPRDKGDRWNWCMGGRKPAALGQPTAMDMHLTRTRSLPQALTGISTLSGNIGGPPSPFHGLHTRKFGTGTWDGRMRGGKLARDGWAGTFPSREIRPA